MAYISGQPDLSGILNAVLGGLVAITANCNYVEPWAAVVIGIFAALTYTGSSYMLKKLKIDDVIDASPVHYFCGIWGLLATGLFVSDDLTAHAPGLFYGGGRLLGWQIVGIIIITLWTAVITAACFFLLKLTGRLRVSAEEEKIGLDQILLKHGIAPPMTPSREPIVIAADKTDLDIEAPAVGVA